MVYSVNHWFTVFVRVFFVNHWFITWFFPFELLKLRVFFPHAHPDPSGTILRSMWPGHVQLELFLHQLRSQGGWEDDDGRTRTRNWRVYDSNFFFTPKCIHSQDFHPILLNEKIQLSCQVSHAATLVQVRLTAASMGPKGALSATGKDRCLHHAAVCFLTQFWWSQVSPVGPAWLDPSTLQVYKVSAAEALRTERLEVAISVGKIVRTSMFSRTLEWWC